ncbi:uncharacterized protein LOC130677947 [Microplitis mediator]|uniref:uncharacterized protein LOC130677947 n=1 Tax=Microplitis mediator TaxID=375433 RepID=UPI00255446A3|nr:uncharacterized protein LOC130677947 [Microplitis mediator]
MLNFLKIILAICLLVRKINGIDVHLADDIDKITDFVVETLNINDDDKLKDKAKNFGDLDIDGEKNYQEIVDKYFVKLPKKDVNRDEIIKLKGLIKKVDDVWGKYGTAELNDDDKAELADLPGTLSELFKLYTGNGKGDLPSRISKDERPSICQTVMNDQVRLWKLHQAVVLSELRGLFLNLKAGNDRDTAAAQAILHSEEYILATVNGFIAAKPSHCRCDPEEHDRGKTFTEFLGLFQGIMVNEVQSSNRQGDTCTNSCGTLENSRIEKCYMQTIKNRTEVYCQEKECQGKLFNCNKGGDTTACELGKSSDRRIQWADTTEAGVLGVKGDDCDGEEKLLKDYDKGETTCPVCYCTCAEEDGKSEVLRAISLIPQFSDIKKNKIVTGVQFVEQDQLIHIQIEQSSLVEFGEIDPGSEGLVDLKSFTYRDSDPGYFEMRADRKDKKLADGVGFKFITSEDRKISLDQVVAPEGEVIVGVTFAWNENTRAIELRILSWPFNFVSGRLTDPVDLSPDDNLEWISWENSATRSKYYNTERSQVDLDDLDDPIKAMTPNKPYSKPNQELEIGATGYKVDMAQHTIPYLDLLPVTYSEVKSPLRGLEIIYKRSEGYGGFLAFKIHTYDFTDKFVRQMSQMDLDKYQANFDDSLVLDVPVK